MPKKKYYAVVLGRKAGVFDTWAECEEQVDGFSGALFKSFKTTSQAEEWVALQVKKISGSDRRMPIEVDLDSVSGVENSWHQGKPTVLIPESYDGPPEVRARISLDVEETKSASPEETSGVRKRSLVANPYKRKRNVSACSAASPQGSPPAQQTAIASTEGLHRKVTSVTKADNLIAMLLKVPVRDYVRCNESGWESDKLWMHFCEKQSTPVLRGPIQNQYANPNTHLDCRKSLVLEEVRAAIAEPLINRWSQQKGPVVLSTSIDFARKQEGLSLLLRVKAKAKPCSDGTLILTLHRPFPGDRAVKPNWFTDQEKEHMINGGIFECVSLFDFSLGNVVLAAVVPCDPKRINKLMEFDVKVATEFSARMLPDAEFRCTPLLNITGYDREFQALHRDPLRIAFMNALMGRGQAHSCRSQLDTSGVTTLPTEGTRTDVIADNEEDDLSKVHLPELNATQKVAISSFLEAPRASISIIQGPPGTGKTTLLVSAITHFLLPEATKTARGRILVCAPTNKAVSVLAVRFYEAVRNTGIRFILVGDDKKLLEESGGKKSPLKPFYVYHWQSTIEERLAKILKFCDSKRPKVTATEAWRSSTCLRTHITASILDLPKNFKDSLTALCTQLKKCCDGECLRSECTSLVRDICVEFAAFPVDHVRTQILNSAHVIFSTLCSSGGAAMTKMTLPVDALVVDEAAAATEPSLYIPFCHGPSKLLVVGDPKQLPAVVISDKAKALGLDKSLHERLMYKCGHPFTMLDVQYRMNPEISRFPTIQFYDRKVNDGDNVRDLNRQDGAFLFNRRPYIFAQVSGLQSQNAAGSSYNIQEADAVVSIVEELCEARNVEWCQNSARLRIITFYRGQVALIKKKLVQKKMEGVLVGTVDASQGCEADVVIISFVRSGVSAGFLTDDRRMNVSLTRAKHQLICVGNVNQFPFMKDANTLHNLANNATTRDVVVKCLC